MAVDGEKENPGPRTWREAFMRSPGPRSWREAFGVFVKGGLMGAADIVPGVSGGTIAFITGIYTDFINAVASFGKNTLADFCRGDGKRALAGTHARFLLCLLFGIIISVFTLSGTIQHCMDAHPVPTWSFFFGLIVGSICIIFREVPHWSPARAVLLLAGAAAAWWVCGLIPVSTPETYPFYFLCGVIAICAMALPGISGSFLLLVLGKYYNIVAAVHTLKNAVKAALGCDWAAVSALLFDPAVSPLWLLVCLALGDVCGLVFFSRFLKWLLGRWREGTMCVLTGMMVGALRKVWPWKQQVRLDCLHADGTEKIKVIEENLVTPGDFARPYVQAVTDKFADAADAVREVVAPAGDPQLFPALGMMLFGAALVLVIEFVAKRKNARAASSGEKQGAENESGN